MLDFFSENTIDLLNGMNIPSTYWKDKSLEYRYWFRSLIHKIDSSIIFKNLPKGWSNDFFMFCLWCKGYVLVFKTDRKDLLQYGENGIVFNPCTLGGYNFYYQPTFAIVANPYMPSKFEYKFDIEGKDKERAALLKLTPDFLGVLDIIDYYASKLAELSKGIDMSIINSKFGLIASASNEAQAATLKSIMDELQKGNPLVVYKDQLKETDEIIPRKEPFEIWVQELKKNYILTEQLQDFQTILNSFYTEIGLPVAIEKKERMITSEADFASAQSQARIACWVETLRECLEIINEKFNTNIEVEYAREINDTGDREGAEPSKPGRQPEK